MNEDFITLISCAVKSIEIKDFKEARNYICKAILLCTSAPQPFNLLGILEEYKGNFLQACKYYRAAYALDPTYKAAANNLARVTTTLNINDREFIDFGSISKESKEQAKYYVEYDLNHVGYIRKNKKDR